MSRPRTYEANELDPACNKPLKSFYPSHNITHSTSDQPRKRKHGEFTAQVTGQHDIGNPFNIQAPPGSISETSSTLVPRLLIPRSCLPLAFLDVQGTAEGIHKTRIFSAEISSLEASLSPKQHGTGPVILIAQFNVTPCLYAVEHVRSGIYALCKLGAWVKLKDLEMLVLGSKPQPNLKGLEQALLPGNKWWHKAAIGEGEAVPDLETRRCSHRTADGFQLCLKAPVYDKPLAPSPLEEITHVTPHTKAPIIPDRKIQETPLHSDSQNADEILKMIRTQYQEALYMSQTSLAYYAKGPLSRARACFHGNNVSSSNHRLLPEFLRSCILNLSVMDKKYCETLPNLVKELPMAALSDDENGAMIEATRKKPRKSKNCNKIGKNGLYPEEAANIARWWTSRKTGADRQDLPNCREEYINARVLVQRAREIQLQIILILETLALEISTSDVKAEDVSSQILDKDHLDQSQKPKSKKPKDLNTLLDVLVDRLCIWQSMNADETDSSPKGKHDAAQTSKGTDESSRLNNLRAFCIDVVLPFYGARLPSLSNMLCQKFGGPKQHSPARPPLVKAATCGALLRPGTTLRRQPTQKSRRTLERVMTDERLASRRPTPSLSRSATDSVLPGLKRESSIVSLYAIPPTKVDLQKSRRYNQREVDLGATTQAHDAKLKKKAKVEQELQGAIAALKKPNPRMAVKEFVEAAERRAAASSLRKPKIPRKNPSAQGVQVVATPSVNRRKDVYGGQPGLPRTITVTSEPDEIPVSSAIQAVSCTPKASDNSTNFSGRHLPAAHEETPTRGPLKLIKSRSSLSLNRNQQQLIGRPPGTPLSARDVVPSTAMKDASNLRSFPLFSPNSLRTPTRSQSHSSQRNNIPWGIDDTPIKVPKGPLGSRQEKLMSPHAVNENSVSIYESLGWNDDIDELS